MSLLYNYDIIHLYFKAYESIFPIVKTNVIFSLIDKMLLQEHITYQNYFYKCHYIKILQHNKCKIFLNLWIVNLLFYYANLTQTISKSCLFSWRQTVLEMCHIWDIQSESTLLTTVFNYFSSWTHPLHQPRDRRDESDCASHREMRCELDRSTEVTEGVFSLGHEQLTIKKKKTGKLLLDYVSCAQELLMLTSTGPMKRLWWWIYVGLIQMIKVSAPGETNGIRTWHIVNINV